MFHYRHLVYVFVCIVVSVKVESGTKWEYFKFAQFWPKSACMELLEKNKSCNVPQGVPSWTVHGLWPSNKDAAPPTYCNNSNPFNINKIRAIETQLKKIWPNLHPTIYYEFWEHEWNKHGTCSTDLPATKDQLSYFSKGLELHATFDIKEMLVKRNVTAGIGYKLERIEEALAPYIGKKRAIIQCYKKTTAKGKPVQFLKTIQICLDQSFVPMRCPFTESLLCTSNYSVIYPL